MSNVSGLVQIDGSFGEGGGQIIRTALSLAAITGRAVEISNVRGRRTKPGLQPQHLTAVRAAGSLCAATVSGDSVGSTHLVFEPQTSVQPGDYRFDIGTAGATSLVVQTVLMPLALVGGASGGASGTVSRVIVTGGTHVPHSPSVEYLEAVYVPVLRRAGLDVTLTYGAAGFYPRGGGHVEVEIAAPATSVPATSVPAVPPAPLDLGERGRLESLRAFVVTANLPAHVAERGAATVEQAMKAIGRKVVTEHRDKTSPGPGAAVVVAAQCQNGIAAFSSVGELRKPMEKVAQAPCQEFLRWWKSGASCDEHLADQLVLPLCFASGESQWTTPVVTEHLRTVLQVAQQFLPIQFWLEEHDGGCGTVRLQGVGSQ
jgi:RNA 3'-terminal phosphate cyclase (ATP)